jgi:thiamine biosynthesis lipoprotein
VSLFFLYLYLQLCTTAEFHTITGTAQGTSYTIKYVGEEGQVSKWQVDSIFRVVDLSLSLYEPASLINTFNREGRVKMDEHMSEVLAKSLDCYTESGGSFDITVGALTDLWGFGPGSHQHIPSSRKIKKQLAITGSNHLRVKGDSLFTLKKGLKIDCNGIAQGYTVDLLRNYISNKGIDQLMVELGGEISVQGDHPENVLWKIGIATCHL